MIHAKVGQYVAQATAYTVNNANLDRGTFYMIYKIDCCAANESPPPQIKEG